MTRSVKAAKGYKKLLGDYDLKKLTVAARERKGGVRKKTLAGKNPKAEQKSTVKNNSRLRAENKAFVRAEQQDTE